MQEPQPVVKPKSASRIGTILGGQYELLELVGEGGLGTVFKARDITSLEKIVAIKVLRDNIRNDAVAMKRLRHEAKTLATLTHPNVVKVLALKFEEQQTFLVMEFLSGRTLAEVLDSGGAVESNRLRRLFAPVARALQHAHDRGIVHRDLKPSNLLLIDEGKDRERLIIVDFGIAKVLEETSEQTATTSGSCVGTAYYMSPEQSSGTTVDGRADIYSLGCVLFELATGTKPFDGNSAMEVLYKHAHEPFPIMRMARADELQQIIQVCTAKNTAERYQTMRELADVLEGSTTVRHAEEPLKHTSQTSFNRGALIKLCCFILLLLVGAGLFYFFGTGKESENTKTSLQADQILNEFEKVVRDRHSTVPQLTTDSVVELEQKALALHTSPKQRVQILTLSGNKAELLHDFHTAKNRYTEAIHEAFVNGDVSAARAAMNLAKLYARTGDTIEARDTLLAEIAHEARNRPTPEYNEMKLRLALYYSGLNQCAEAEQIVSELPAGSAPDLNVNRLRIHCRYLESVNQSTEAIKELRKFLATDSPERTDKFTMAELNAMLGFFLGRQDIATHTHNNEREAYQCFQNATRVAPYAKAAADEDNMKVISRSVASSFLQMGLIDIRRKQYRLAEQEAEAALSFGLSSDEESAAKCLQIQARNAQ